MFKNKVLSGNLKFKDCLCTTLRPYCMNERIIKIYDCTYVLICCPCHRWFKNRTSWCPFNLWVNILRIQRNKCCHLGRWTISNRLICCLLPFDVYLPVCKGIHRIKTLGRGQDYVHNRITEREETEHRSRARTDRGDARPSYIRISNTWIPFSNTKLCMCFYGVY